MKKSVSLKEFSTTPTVSYMLSKDGHNVASGNSQAKVAPSAQQPPKEEAAAPQPDPSEIEDVMYEME